MKCPTRFKVYISAMSANRTTTENREATKQLRVELGVRFSSVSECLGSYAGMMEDSFCVEVHSPSGFGEVLMLGAQYHQQTILVEDCMGRAYLFGCRVHEIQPLGVAVYFNNKEEVIERYSAMPHAWTMFKDSGRYMIAEV